MSMIFVNFSLFDKKQNIYLVSEEGAQFVTAAEFPNLGKVISDLCDVNDVSTVRLAGDKGYLNILVEDIKTSYSLNYGNSDDLEFIMED